MKNKKLRKSMIDADVKVKDLATKTGVSDTQIRRILNGDSNGSLDWWRKASDVLGVAVGDILE